jgi:drug/metabolite transporter (DMT)-like permease
LYLGVWSSENDLYKEVSLHQIGKIICLSFLYLINNHTAFYLFKFADPGTISIVKSGSIFMSAFILYMFIKRNITKLQWLAICIQIGGLLSSQYDECKKAGLYAFEFYILLFVSTSITSFCGCFNDSITKEKDTSLHGINIWLYLSGFIFNLLYYIYLQLVSETKEPGFFDGFSGWGIGIITINSFIGLAITAVYKYTDAVMKCMAQSISSSILLFFSMLFFGIQLRLVALAGCFEIFLGTYIYVTSGIDLYKDKKEETLINKV